VPDRAGAAAAPVLLRSSRGGVRGGIATRALALAVGGGSARASSGGGAGAVVGAAVGSGAVVSGSALSVEPLAGASSASLTGVLDLVICDIETHRVCVPVRRTVKADFAVQGAAEAPAATLELPAAR